jgi:hypothetical protein
MWLGFGLAFLTKGPPGLLPLLPIVVFVVWSGGARGAAAVGLGGGARALRADGVFLVLAAGRARPDLLSYLLGFEVGGRLLGAQERNPGWRGLLQVIVAVAIAGLLPWSAVAVFTRRDVAATPRVPRGPPLPLALAAAAAARLQPRAVAPAALPAAAGGARLAAGGAAPRPGVARGRGASAAGSPCWAAVLVALAAVSASGRERATAAASPPQC